MSQKSKDFQPKAKKFSGGARGASRPAGRTFNKKFEGDRGHSGSDRPARSFSRDDSAPRQRREGSYEKRPRSFDRDSRPSEGRASRPPREGGYEKRPQRSFDRDSGAPRQRREGGYEGKPRSYEGKPRSYDRSSSRSSEGSSSRPPREGGYEKRPQRSFDRDSGAPRQRREGGYEGKPRSYDRTPRSTEGRTSRPAREGSYEKRPQRSFDKSPERGSDAARPERKAPPGRDRFAQKSYTRYDEKKGGPRKFDSKKREPRRYEESAPAAEASFETRQRLKSDRQTYGAPSSAFLYGVHAVTAALKNPKRLHQRLLCTEKGFESIQDVFQAGLDAGLKLPNVIYVEREDIERLLPRDAVHQDILLDCQPLEEIFLGDLLVSMPKSATVLVLDQVTDPHNVGAILRSAAAFGASAIIAQKLHAPEITGTVAKSASGAVEHVPLVREVNLSRALDTLKEAGFLCIGLDEGGEKTLAEVAPQGRTAIVLGAEGDGIRRLVSEHCDTLARLPTQGDIASLNVSNAAAIALYECSRSRK